jgi:predicted ArsR family transcriptional regulator
VAEHGTSADDTRGRLLALLCGGNRTSASLAEELGISANGVRGHLHILREAGLVEHDVVRRGVGKPAHEYRLTAAGSARLSRLYVPLLSAMLSVTRDQGGVEAEETLLRAAGRSLAQGCRRPDGDVPARAQAVVEMITELGGISSLEEENGELAIRGSCCLVRSLVADHPLACKAIESMVSELVGVPVREACDKTMPPSCRLVIRQS